MTIVRFRQDKSLRRGFKMRSLPTDTMLLDGSGDLNWQRKKPKAERFTRQELREASPSGVVEFQKKNYFGFWAFISVMAISFVNALIAAYFIIKMVM